MKINEFFLAEPFAYYIIKNLGNTYENVQLLNYYVGRKMLRK